MARPTFQQVQGDQKVPLHLNLRQKQWERLDDLSAQNGKTKAELVRSAIDKMLASESLKDVQ